MQFMQFSGDWTLTSMKYPILVSLLYFFMISSLNCDVSSTHLKPPKVDLCDTHHPYKLLASQQLKCKDFFLL